MCFPKNFPDVLRTLTLSNTGRLLLLKYLLKIKIAKPDKFSEAAAFKIDGLKNFALISKKHLCYSLFLIKLQA